MAVGSDLTKRFLDAIDARDTATARAMLADGVDVDSKHPWQDGRALHRAVCDPVDLALLELLLQYAPEVDRRHPETGGTALHQLLHAGCALEVKLAALDLLIAHGADLDAVGEDADGERYTAVDLAAAGGPPMQALHAALVDRGGRAGPDASG